MAEDDRSEANLVEIFSSVQGEGPHVGETTLFVRFGECDLRCRWCDSPHTWQRAPQCRVETRRGTGAFRTLTNPVSIEQAVGAAAALEVGEHRFASLTGGEPLLQPAAVLALARALRRRGPRIYLETHGLATAALERVIEAQRPRPYYVVGLDARLRLLLSHLPARLRDRLIALWVERYAPRDRR